MADISSIFFTKLLNYMRDNDMAKVRTLRLNHISHHKPYCIEQVVPRVDPNVKRQKFHGGLTSGYLARAADQMPGQGDRSPWRRGANYILQWLQLTFGSLKTDSLEFTAATKKND